MKRKKVQPRILYPARLSFRFDREIKSFPDKQNLREFSAIKPDFTTNAKGTSLGNKHKRRKRSTENKPKTLKKMVIGTNIFITTLNVNGLNAPTKRHTLTGHTCTSTYHITLPNTPPPTLYSYYIVRLSMFPLWLVIVVIFYFLSGY